MSMVDGIANEIILASLELHTNSVSRIATELGYQPILIMNGLFAGEKSGKFVYNKKKDIITNISEDLAIDQLSLTEGLEESMEQIELFMEAENSIEVDLTIDEIRKFIPMFPELHMKIALRVNHKLATYDLADPKDPESVYTFVTLKENLEKQWGTKQFDEKKAKKRIKAAIKATNENA
jgi:hypothetical protein